MDPPVRNHPGRLTGRPQSESDGGKLARVFEGTAIAALIGVILTSLWRFSVMMLQYVILLDGQHFSSTQPPSPNEHTNAHVPKTRSVTAGGKLL